MLSYNESMDCRLKNRNLLFHLISFFSLIMKDTILKICLNLDIRGYMCTYIYIILMPRYIYIYIYIYIYCYIYAI